MDGAYIPFTQGAPQMHSSQATSPLVPPHLLSFCCYHTTLEHAHCCRHVGQAQQFGHDPTCKARGNIRCPLCRGGCLVGVRPEGEEEDAGGYSLLDRLCGCVSTPVSIAAVTGVQMIDGDHLDWTMCCTERRNAPLDNDLYVSVCLRCVHVQQRRAGVGRVSMHPPRVFHI